MPGCGPPRPGRSVIFLTGMTALLDALARWGPTAVAGVAAGAVLLLLVAAFALGAAHGGASAVAYSGTAGIVILLAAIAYQATRARDV
jgi:hypothetical protein